MKITHMDQCKDTYSLIIYAESPDMFISMI